MAWLPMYLMREDVELLNDWLNLEDEIAFLTSNGNKRWIARKAHNILVDIEGRDFSNQVRVPKYIEYNLWHIPSGPLPLIGTSMSETLKFWNKDQDKEKKVLDPWSGWKEVRTGANSEIPYFGAGHPGVMHLEVKLSDKDIIPMSSFGWIGNHYKIIGNGAEKSTEKFWSKLRRMAKKYAAHIPRGNMENWKKEIYAFPAAYKDIVNGKPCSINP